MAATIAVELSESGIGPDDAGRVVIPARGEVWWYEPPDAKRRPHLVLARSEAVEVLSFIVCVPLTSRIRGIRSEVRLGLDDGLPVECVASLDNVRSVARALLTERLTTLTPVTMQAVCDALKFTIDC